MCIVTQSRFVKCYIAALRDAIAAAIQQTDLSAAPNHVEFCINPHAEIQLLNVQLDDKGKALQQQMAVVPDKIDYSAVQVGSQFKLTHDETIMYFFDVEGDLVDGKLSRLDVTLATEEVDFLEFLHFRGLPRDFHPDTLEESEETEQPPLKKTKVIIDLTQD